MNALNLDPSARLLDLSTLLGRLVTDVSLQAGQALVCDSSEGLCVPGRGQPALALLAECLRYGMMQCSTLHSTFSRKCSLRTWLTALLSLEVEKGHSS